MLRTSILISESHNQKWLLLKRCEIFTSFSELIRFVLLSQIRIKEVLSMDDLDPKLSSRQNVQLDDKLMFHIKHLGNVAVIIRKNLAYFFMSSTYGNILSLITAQEVSLC